MKIRRRVIAPVVRLGLVCLASVLQAQAAKPVPLPLPPSYTFYDLGTIGPPEYPGMSPRAINNRGEIVGCAQYSRVNPHAFLYSHGKLKDLGTPEGSFDSCATAISDSGAVTGNSSSFAGTVAWVYRDGKFEMIPLPMRTPRGINNAGEVIGTDSFGNWLRYKDGKTEKISGMSGGAFGINAEGAIAGSMRVNNFLEQAVIYKSGEAKNIGASVSPYSSVALAINNRGQATGSFWTSQWSYDAQHAFVYDGQKAYDITPSNSADTSVSGINGRGEVVGRALVTDGDGYPSYSYIFVYTKASGLVDLSTRIKNWKTVPTSWMDAVGINDAGWIIGDYSTGTESGRAFVLVPNWGAHR